MASFTFQIKRLGKKYADDKPEVIAVKANDEAAARVKAEAKFRRRQRLAPQVALSTKLADSEPDAPDPAGELTVGQFRNLVDAFFLGSLADSLGQSCCRFRLAREFCIGGVPTSSDDPLLGRFVSEELDLTGQQIKRWIQQVRCKVPATLHQRHFDQLMAASVVSGLAVRTCEYRYTVEVWNNAGWQLYQEFSPTNPTYPVGHVKYKAAQRA